MFLHFLVPLDGSPRAERALQIAAALAKQTLAGQSGGVPLVTLFRALDLSAWRELAAFEEARIQAMDQATSYLDALAEGLRSEGLTVETLVRLGTPAEALLEQILARRIDLVVMATHGRGGLARWALGSVAERIARTSPVPVFLLPDAAPATLVAADPEGAAYSPRILVPLDGSAKAEAALLPATELARLLHAEVRLLSVLAPKFEESRGEETPSSRDVDQRHRAQVEQYLILQGKALQQAGVKTQWALGYGLPGAKIMATAHRQQVSLIVMTTQGRGGLVRWRLGSVAEAVLHDGYLLVLLVPTYEGRSSDRDAFHAAVPPGDLG